MRLKLAQARITEPKHPDETLPALEARVSALAELPDRIDAFGPVHLYRAVQKAVVSERYATAVRLMAHLRDTFTSDPEFYLPSRDEGLLAGKPGTVLVAALDHADRRIAYHAAITLAHLDPKLEFFNAERVIPLLSQAVGEWGMKVVLVVEPDYRERNAARKALQDQGLLVFTAADGFEARMRLAESPVKDAIIVAGDLVPSLRDDNGQLIDVPEQTAAGLIQALRGEPSTAETPIFLSLPQNDELAVQVQNALGDQVDAVIGKPFNGVEMAGAVETAIGDDELPEINRQAREDIAQAAAEALGSIDPVKSQFALAGALDSLLATISLRADPIRIPALRAIGHIGAADLVAAVTDVYQELDRSGDLTNDDVRIAFLDCIGMLDPNTPAAIEIIAAAMQSENREVRRAAHLAAGHGRAIAPQTLLLYQTQQRLDVRASGAAGE
jgi:CheY-like chemotaxis protein